MINQYRRLKKMTKKDKIMQVEIIKEPKTLRKKVWKITTKVYKVTKLIELVVRYTI